MDDEDDDDIAETDVEDSPQVTEVPLEFLFPSSKPKRALPETKVDDEEGEVTQPGPEPVVADELTEVIAHTDDVADTDADEGEEVTQRTLRQGERSQSGDTITRAAVECDEAVVRESSPEVEVFALPGRPVKMTEPELESVEEETEAEEVEQTRRKKKKKRSSRSRVSRSGCVRF